MTIRETEQTASGVWKITPSDGSAFFLREDYLSRVSPHLFSAVRSAQLPVELGEGQADDLVSAALAYAAEQLAMSYLARAEQCRQSLAAKLSKKGLDLRGIQAALDYLEGKGYLDDRRFAGAWLRSRSITHTEGRLRLKAELTARGIARNDAEAALDEFFSDHDEDALCRKALARERRFRADENKLFNALIRKGFSPAHIRSAMDSEKQGE